MITVTYDPHGQDELGISDGETDRFADHIQGAVEHSKTDIEYKILNFLVINEIRARIAENKIDHTKIQFKFQGQIIVPNNDGTLSDYPRGFGDTDILIVRRILSARKLHRDKM